MNITEQVEDLLEVMIDEGLELKDSTDENLVENVNDLLEEMDEDLID